MQPHIVNELVLLKTFHSFQNGWSKNEFTLLIMKINVNWAFKNVSMFLGLNSAFLYFIPANQVSSFGIFSGIFSSQITAITWPWKREVDRNDKAPDELFLYTLGPYPFVWLTLIFAYFLYWKRTFQLFLIKNIFFLLYLPHLYKFLTWNFVLLMWHNVSNVNVSSYSKNKNPLKFCYFLW